MIKTISKNKSFSMSAILFYLALISTGLEQQMYITDHAFPEATFAIAQIKIPHADKAFIKTKCQHLITLLQKTLAPAVQGLGIALADIFQMFETQFLLGSGLSHRSEERRVGKSVGLDERSSGEKKIRRECT